MLKDLLQRKLKVFSLLQDQNSKAAPMHQRGSALFSYSERSDNGVEPLQEKTALIAEESKHEWKQIRFRFRDNMELILLDIIKCGFNSTNALSSQLTPRTISGSSSVAHQLSFESLSTSQVANASRKISPSWSQSREI